MSEYEFVEKPFLDQLKALDWSVIDQGPDIPSDPAKSLRTSFREVILRDEFNKAVRRINVTDDGQEWLTDKQLDKLFDEITGQSGSSLREINEKVQELLYRIQADQNELTGEDDPNVVDGGSKWWRGAAEFGGAGWVMVSRNRVVCRGKVVTGELLSGCVCDAVWRPAAGSSPLSSPGCDSGA